MTKTKIIIGVIVVIIIIGGIWYGVSRKQVAEKETIKIGVILPLTGKAAQYGQWAKNGFALAIEEVNSLDNYPYHLELIYEDDRSNSKDGVSAFQKMMLTHHPSVVIGWILSNVLLSVASIAEENQIVLLSTSASAYELRYAGDYIFRVRESGTIHGHLMADYIFNQLKIRKVGALYANAENGITYAEGFKEKFLNLGGKIDFYEAFNEEETDFRTHLIKAKNAKLEALYVAGLATEIGRILKQAKELGLEMKFLSSAGAENPKVVEIAGEASENLIYTYPVFNPDSSDSNIQVFVNNYLEKFGEKPEFIAANSYDAIKILALVFEKYGHTSTQIKDGLYTIKNYNGVGGNLSFDEYGDVIKPVSFKTIKNGQFVLYPYEE